MTAKKQYWTASEDVCLLSLNQDGFSADDIGKRMNRTRLSVRNRLRRLGVASKHAGPRTRATRTPFTVPDVPRIFDREPCFKCGVRGDLGCKHKPVFA